MKSAERRGGLEVDDELELGRWIGRLAGLAPYGSYCAA